MKLIMTDGAKSVNLLNSDDPSVWTFYSNAPKSTQDILYARVSAAFRAYNLKANTVGNMPFVLTSAGGAEYDSSATWENKVGFLPNPSELFRLDTLSYIATNTIYNIKTTDLLGYKQRGLYHAVPYNFQPFIRPDTGGLEYIERRLGTGIERYKPDDKRLFRAWRLDHTTEVLPSPNTEAQAIMNAAGEVYAADLWIKHFYERGGVPPTVIAMKGAIAPNKKDDEEKSWGDWLRGLGRYLGKPARVFNADALDVKQFGSSVTDLKNNEIYQRAIANIAMGTGMPLSLLLANSSNYATAQEEKATWYESDIIPFCNWLSYHYNEQIFEPLGLMLVFNPETLQSQQQDEREVAQAYSTYITSGMKPSVAAQILGIELPDGVAFEDLDKMQEEKQQEALERQQVLFDKDKPGEEQPKDKEQKEEKETIKSTDVSAMIALRVPDAIRKEIKETYPFVDSETLDNLHITLVYLGDNRTINKTDVMRSVSDLGLYQSPIKGKLQGLARFRNGRDVDPLVMTFDSPQMPKLYNTLCSILDSYHVPFHKEHGFIPHMTLTYIPKDADMPIDFIEPIEINFLEVYYVDGNVWLPVSLFGYDNKNLRSTWIPKLDELDELKTWRKAVLSAFKQGKPLTFEYIPHYGGLPEAVTDDIKSRLSEQRVWDGDRIKTIFDIAQMIAEQPEPQPDNEIKALAESINRLAESFMPKMTVST